MDKQKTLAGKKEISRAGIWLVVLRPAGRWQIAGGLYVITHNIKRGFHTGVLLRNYSQYKQAISTMKESNFVVSITMIDASHITPPCCRNNRRESGHELRKGELNTKIYVWYSGFKSSQFNIKMLVKKID